MNRIPGKHEHLARDDGEPRYRRYAHRQSIQGNPDPADAAVYEAEPVACSHCGHSMRIIALIDDGGVMQRIVRHLTAWGPPPEPRSATGPDPPVPNDETVPLTGHPVVDNT